MGYAARFSADIAADLARGSWRWTPVAADEWGTGELVEPAGPPRLIER